MEDHFEKQYKVILADTPQWAIDLFKFNSRNKGDCIFLAAIVAIATKDRQMLLNLVDLLRQRRRWPKELDLYSRDAPSMFIQYLDQVLTWYNRRASRTQWMPIIPWRKRYRYVKGMTRDPFTMVIVAWEVLMEGPCPVKVPILIQRPSFLFWVRYMKTKRIWQKYLYEFLTILGNEKAKPMFAIHLNCWRAWAADSDRIKHVLLPVIPDWNFLLRLLVEHPLNYLSEDRMAGYKAKSGYAWTDEKCFIPPKDSRFYLDDKDEIKPDKQILDFILNGSGNRS